MVIKCLVANPTLKVSSYQGPVLLGPPSQGDLQWLQGGVGTGRLEMVPELVETLVGLVDFLLKHPLFSFHSNLKGPKGPLVLFCSLSQPPLDFFEGFQILLLYFLSVLPELTLSRLKSLVFPILCYLQGTLAGSLSFLLLLLKDPFDSPELPFLPPLLYF